MIRQIKCKRIMKSDKIIKNRNALMGQ
uniref:Uncharacterized protein n=1 Tax=Tetranychus urticae TaxID=32264 RepID=T1JX29_TETUR